LLDVSDLFVKVNGPGLKQAESTPDFSRKQSCSSAQPQSTSTTTFKIVVPIISVNSSC